MTGPLARALALGGALVLIACPTAVAEQTRSGTLEVAVADDFRSGESVTQYGLRSQGRSIPVLSTEPVEAMSGDRVSVTGSFERGTLVGEVAEKAEVVEEPLARTRTIAIVLVTFEMAPEEPWSVQEVREQLVESDRGFPAFYREESHGRLVFRGKSEPGADVFGWLTLQGGGEECDKNLRIWMQEARKRVDLSGYDNVMLIASPTPECTHGGRGQLGGSDSYLFETISPKTATHELGHNLGLWHANLIECFDSEGNEVTLGTTSASCIRREYGDRFDVMGGLYRHHHGWFQAMLGLLGSSNVISARREGTYSIVSGFDETDLPTVLRVPRAWDADGLIDEWYDLEIRKETAPGESEFELLDGPEDQSAAGVTIRIADLDGSRSFLIDSRSGPPVLGGPWILDAPFEPGAVFDDGRVRIEVLEAGEGKAKVSVEFDDPGGDQFAPTAPVLTSIDESESGVRVRWEASEDDLGVERYLLYRDGVPLGLTTELDFLDPEPPPGLHAYVAYAEDASGHRSDASNALTCTVADVEAPTRPTTLAATLDPGGVKLAWKPSSDNDAIAKYRVLRDGEEIGFNWVPSFLDPDPLSTSRTYAVYAEDYSGHKSALSEPLEVADEDPPSAPGGLRATLTPTAVALNWSTSLDNVSVARYLLYRDGVLLGEAGATAYADVAPPSGAHAYAVRAVDLANNGSSLSDAVWVLVPGSASRDQDQGLAAPALPGTGKRRRSMLRLWVHRSGRNRIVIGAIDLGKLPEAELELWIDGKLAGSTRKRQLRVVREREWTRRARHLVVARELDGNRLLARRAVRIGGPDRSASQTSTP